MSRVDHLHHMTSHAPRCAEFLRKQFADAGVASSTTDGLLEVVAAIARGSGKTAVALRHTMIEKVQTTNEFGDDVLTADLVADKLISDQLRSCAHIATFASEEHPVLKQCSDAATRFPRDHYTVTFDPLDGSSIIDTNFAVGAIFAVWRGTTCIGQTAGDIELSAITVFGPRTTLFIAHRKMGLFEFYLVDDDKSDWRLVRSKRFTVNAKTKYFSPGNLRAANQSPGYTAFLKQAVRSNLTLRYTGGMVPDVTQIFIKGSGIFATPVSAKHKVKLRVCFECGPFAHMMECAGGAAVDETGAPYRDVKVTAVDQRSGIILGSADAVATLVELLKTKDQPPSKL